MTDTRRNTEETHALELSGLVPDTGEWLSQRAERVVFAPGHGGVGMGWVIQNRDGSVVVACMGDTLVFDGTRITRR